MTPEQTSTFAREKYPEFFETYEKALQLLPDDAPELEPYRNWSFFTQRMLHVLIQGAPESSPEDGSDETFRQRMARNFLIEALETLDGTMPVEMVRAVNEAVKAVRGET